MESAAIGLFSIIVGLRIRESRIRANVPQASLACGLATQSTISHLEQGKKVPEVDTLEEIGRRLNDQRLKYYAVLLKERGFPEILQFLDPNELLEGLRLIDPPWSEELSAIVLDTCSRLKDTDELSAVYEQIIQAARIGVTRTKALLLYGTRLNHQGKYKDAMRWLKESEKDKHLLEPLFQAQLLYNLANACLSIDSYYDALSYGPQAAEAYLHNNNVEGYVQSLMLIGISNLRIGQLENSRRVLERALKFVGMLDDSSHLEVQITLSLAEVHESTGDWTGAIRLSKQCLAIATLLDDNATVSLSYGILARAYSAIGSYEISIELSKKCIEVAECVEDSRTKVYAYLTKMRLCIDVEGKYQAALIAHAVTKKTSLYYLHAVCCEFLANLSAIQGNHIDANQYACEAMVAYRNLLRHFVLFDSTIRPLLSYKQNSDWLNSGDKLEDFTSGDVGIPLQPDEFTAQSASTNY